MLAPKPKQPASKSALDWQTGDSAVPSRRSPGTEKPKKKKLEAAYVESGGDDPVIIEALRVAEVSDLSFDESLSLVEGMLEQ